ncbi:uncharacterized protein JN550_004622 [Neoarthrinium moseri]|uniref:uncharacterized protein n=1 Tax=Neoarthrinium moseri TaxID=1658444 RepID=UPI001FDBE3E0|nr:uncharacterized protein JN550_004622 [Neoarthrinium moseri]KAI1871177.1 hypothetical protein JN550_004622 [Neoarthrinium moseri]
MPQARETSHPIFSALFITITFLFLVADTVLCAYSAAYVTNILRPSTDARFRDDADQPAHSKAVVIYFIFEAVLWGFSVLYFALQSFCGTRTSDTSDRHAFKMRNMVSTCIGVSIQLAWSIVALKSVSDWSRMLAQNDGELAKACKYLMGLISVNLALGALILVFWVFMMVLAIYVHWSISNQSNMDARQLELDHLPPRDNSRRTSRLDEGTKA